jgi:hypothetical protein
LPATEVPQSFAVTGLPQSISFSAIAPLTINGTSTLSASATSGLAVTFSSQTPQVCSVSAGVVTGLTAGDCTVAADQAGDTSHWAAAPTVTQTVTVARDAQTITVPSIPDEPAGGESLQLGATSSSGLPVSYTSQTPQVCSVNGTSVTILAVGTCTLVAMQSGNGTYATATPVSLSFNVVPEGDNDGPLPNWALLLMAVMLAGAALQRSRRTT